MARDSLNVLIKIRRLACDESMRQLAEAFAAEDRAVQAVHAADRVIALETEAAQSAEGTDAMVEAFGAWLPGARRKLEAAKQHLATRQAETVRCRAELAICKTALETVEQLRADRKAEAERGRERRVERELDDIASRAREGDCDE